MFESGNSPNQDPLNDLKSKRSVDDIDDNISPENLAVRKKQLEKILIKLIAFGLACGTVLGIGTYYLLSKLGLNKKPYQLEQERIEREKQEKENQEQVKEQTSFPEISAFPRIPGSLEDVI